MKKAHSRRRKPEAHKSRTTRAGSRPATPVSGRSSPKVEGSVKQTKPGVIETQVAGEWFNLSAAESFADTFAEGEPDGLWELVEARTTYLEEQEWRNPGQTGPDLWQILEERIDPNRWKPRRRPDYEVVEEPPKPDAPEAEKVYYLKCRSVRAYLKIGEKQLFVWNLLDGNHTVRDIMFAYRQQYSGIPFGVIMKSLQVFKSCRMLEEPEDIVYGRLSQLFERTTRKINFNPLTLLTKAKITIHNVDPKFDRLYRLVGWVFFKPIVWIPLLLISFTGVALALYIFFTGQALAQEIGRLGGGVYALFSYATFLPLIFIHEAMHAMTVKHYRREVMGGGFMLLRGMPAMFIDTSDMWMDRNRWHRVKVSLAGPLANLCAAGVLTLLALQLPVNAISAFMLALALNNIVNAALNMCPLIELDGYFALMDAMDETALRAKSFKFLRKEFPKRWRQLFKFSRKEWFYLIFATFALIYTFAITSCMVMFAIKIVLSSEVGAVAIGSLVVVYGGLRLWRFWKIRRWRKQQLMLAAPGTRPPVKPFWLKLLPGLGLTLTLITIGSLGAYLALDTAQSLWLLITGGAGSGGALVVWLLYFRARQDWRKKQATLAQAEAPALPVPAMVVIPNPAGIKDYP